MASSQEHLRKVALEGFDLIEKLYGRRSKPNDAFWVVQNGEMEKPALKPKEFANYGIPAANYPRGKAPNRFGRPTKF